ncbi:MAG: tRNA (adenosine(37)-N6)-threonylcarbamoyltransferase complex dimerization subunit type 1 TsaB [Acidimicrobiales bacterium]
MTLLLAVESATDVAGVALVDEAGAIRAHATLERGRRHGEHLAPAIDRICSEAGVAVRDVTALAVDVGPGLFTGLRVGVATAKALAFALDIPVVTATSLEVLADGHARALTASPGTGNAPSTIVAVVDGRRGELFWQTFSCTGAGAAGAAGDRVSGDGAERLGTPDELAAALGSLVASHDGAAIICVGDGALRYRDALEVVPGVHLHDDGSGAHPDAKVLAELGRARLEAGMATYGGLVHAKYLRDADVRINWEQRLAPRPAHTGG